MSDKFTTSELSNQVKEILHQKGLSKVFNTSDFTFFKRQCRNAFNKAIAIAEKFIEENQETATDYNDYVY